MFNKFFVSSGKKTILGILIFLLIFGVGIFLRSCHFSDWLIFQSDQSRDALIVHQALTEKFSKLPLIGPQARGSTLHLGPVFYYFQYFSGKIFGPSPESFAYPDLFFGILTLPILFLLLKKFVSRWIALCVASLASVSLFLVTFSRFAWNPNSLPFFSTLFALLFASAIQKDRSRLWILAGLALCIGIIIQLHFIAASSLLLGLFIFLLIYHPLKWKEFLICLLIIFSLQAPTFLYEMKNRGAMSEALLETVEEKGMQDNNHMIHEKIFRAYQSQSEIFWLVATGQQNTDTILTRGFSLKCDRECRSKLPITISSFLLFSFLLWVGFQRWKNEKNAVNRQLMAFFGIWFFGFFFVTALVAYQISTRFYLGIVPVIFLLFGFLIEWLGKNFSNKVSKLLIFIAVSASILLNFRATTVYLKDLSRAKITSEETHKDLVFNTEQKVTLEQLRSIAAETDRKFSDDSPIFISGESRYARSLYYILFAEKERSGCYQKGTVDKPVFQNHVRVLKNKGQDDIISFGTLAIQLISPAMGQKKDALPADCLNY